MLHFHMIKRLLLYFIFIFIFMGMLHANILQETIDNAPAGATLKLPSGIYAGNIVISKPLSIIGKAKNVIIQGEGNGTVITVNSSHVILKNLQIRNSGSRMENLDSAIELHHVKDCEVSHCRITDSLYGIDMNMVEDSIISNNYIRSKKNDISLRGDALKIWYAKNNLIKNNTIEFTRDVTLTYAHNNTIENNTFLHNRFGLHLSMSHNNTIRHNTFKYNSVSILLMGVKDINVTGNTILSSKGAAGIAVVADKVSNFHFTDNTLKYNAKALYIDDFTFCGALHASNLGLSLIDSGKLEDAENFVKQALKINPWSEEAYRTLYAITLKKREYKKALNCLKKLSKIKPKDGEIHLDRAALHYFLNQTAKAKEEYNKGIKLGAKPRQKLEQLILSH